MSLVNIQHSFLYNLIQSKQNATDFISELVAVGSLSVEKQLSIYRSNVSGAHQKVLAQVYPACLNILGEDYFNQLCFFYRFEHPSTQPDLNVYGEHFPCFLEKQISTNEELSEFEYLVDLACLEWHWHTSYFSIDEPVFDFKQFALVNTEDQTRLFFTLSSSFSLHATAYPLLDIWKANKDKADDVQEFALPDTESYFCISRMSFFPEIEDLSDKQYKLLTLISKEVPLLKLSEFGFESELVTFIEKGWVTGFSLHD